MSLEAQILETGRGARAMQRLFREDCSSATASSRSARAESLRQLVNLLNTSMHVGLEPCARARLLGAACSSSKRCSSTSPADPWVFFIGSILQSEQGDIIPRHSRLRSTATVGHKCLPCTLGPPSFGSLQGGLSSIITRHSRPRSIGIC